MNSFKISFFALFVSLVMFAACDDMRGHIAPPSSTCDQCRACRAKLAEDIRQRRDCESTCWNKRNREYLVCKDKVEAWRGYCIAACADAVICAKSCRDIAWDVMAEKCSRLQRQECYCNSSETPCACRGCDTSAPTP